MGRKRDRENASGAIRSRDVTSLEPSRVTTATSGSEPNVGSDAAFEIVLAGAKMIEDENDELLKGLA